MKYDVTIGIPVYNADPYIRKTIESALSQTYPSIEFLIVDDGSVDHSIDIINDLCASHPRGGDIRILTHSQNMGVSASRNQIIDEAQGDYLYFLDADDLIDNNAISLMIQTIRQYNAEIVFGSYEKIELSGERKQYQYPSLQLMGEDKLASFAFRKYAGIQASACNYLVNISLLRETGIRFIDTNYWEDMVFTYQLVTMIVRAVLLPDITYFYCCRENSLSHYQERLTIGKDEILRNVRAVDHLKAYSNTLHKRPYFPNWCYNLVMTDFYMACTVLKRRNDIFPPISNSEVSSFMSHPATLCQICSFQTTRTKNVALYILGKIPPSICVNLIKLVDKVRKLT